MGITIEQYRARTGAHNNVEIKKHSTQMQLEGNLLSQYIMLMLFQLVINTVLIVLLQVFYLCILIYQHKNWQDRLHVLGKLQFHSLECHATLCMLLCC